jgi:YidC/Oxa1 family membrane protein insertase
VKKGFSNELRILFASLLSMVVILLWAKYFAPKPPAHPAPTAQTAPAQTGSAPANATIATPGAAPGAATGSRTAPAPSQPAKEIPAVKADKEQTFVVENDLYRVEFTNRGGVVKSWVLKKYLDDGKPPRMLDLVHPKAAEETGGWPFAIVLDDAQLESQANAALYKVTMTTVPAGASDKSADGKSAPSFVPATPQIASPAAIEFSWSDGRLEVTKRFRFDQSYVLHTEISARLNGAPLKAGLAWLGGFGDLTVHNPEPVETVTPFYTERGKLTMFPHKKLEELEKWGPGLWQGGKDWTGIEDRYFVAAFLPPNGAAPGTLDIRYWKAFHPAVIDGKPASQPVAEVATSSQAQPLALRVFVGPKDYDDLKHMTPPLNSLVQFGMWEILSDPLFHALKWIQNYVPNWGWAIVILTLVINMLLFPLRISSYRTTLKMQRVAPEIKSIQDRYKKYKMNDPRKAEMNKEVMAVYSREGINPVGGCFQMLVQMPIWFALNNSLRYAIELRHAKWFGWITDLSARDPYYILPIVMGIAMYLAAKMTPMTGGDPQQQKMMKFMPISMAAMFVVFPISSGLAVYILTSSVVGIGQQWYLNRQHPVTAVVSAKAKPARSKS